MTKQKKYTLNPSKELITFATDFSENYLTQKPDFYRSGKNGNGKYTIDYISENPKDPKVGRRNFSVGEMSKNFIFSKDELSKYSKNFVFYMVIWMAVHIDNFELYEETDVHALKYYLSTNRSKKDMILGFLQSIKHQDPPTELNIRRLKYIQGAI